MLFDTEQHGSTRAGRLWSRLATFSPLLVAFALSQGALAATPNGARSSQPIEWSFSLDSEVVTNLGGGIAPGSVSDHLAKASFWTTGDALGLPAGARLKATLARTQSGRPTATRIGDTQGVSNIEAPSRSRLYALWYRQRLADNRWSVRLGLIPADGYFDTLDSGALLLNGSFGVQPTWSANTGAPIFPTAAVGAMATWKNGLWLNRTGVFQADPSDRGSALRRGALLMNESVHRPRTPGAGTYKFGIWSYRPHGPESAALPPANWGIYASAEHPLYRLGETAPQGFVRVGWSPKQISAVPLGIQVGVLLPAPFSARPQDQLSLGVARASLRGLGVETAYEVTYLLAISPRLSLQPDLQFVDNPGGAYPSAMVGSVRLHIEFD